MSDRWVHLEVEEVVRETDSAFLLRLEGGEEEWFPKSQVSDSGDYQEGDKDCTISVTKWIADQKGLG